MIWKLVYPLLFLVCSCTIPEEKKTLAGLEDQDTASIQNNTSYTASRDTTLSAPIPLPKKIKKPRGLYRVVLPTGGGMEQIIAFYNDFTYQLQEKYSSNKKDSIVVVNGNWSPSDGYIWLYHDQVVRGRYSWKGDNLQYFNPLSKKNFPMHPLQDALENTAWQNKKNEGVVLFGTGTEPFWSVEYNDRDTVSFFLPEWSQPLRMKVTDSLRTKDSLAYIARNDSIQLRITVLPFFCNDGMSDYVYRNKVRVLYRNQVYQGCGIVYR
jgi:uncharacterized membrane protein